MLGKSWRGGPCIYWTSSPCRRSTDSATTAVRSARQHPECPETSQRCSRNVSFYIAYSSSAIEATIPVRARHGTGPRRENADRRSFLSLSNRRAGSR